MKHPTNKQERIEVAKKKKIKRESSAYKRRTSGEEDEAS